MPIADQAIAVILPYVDKSVGLVPMLKVAVPPATVTNGAEVPSLP